MNKKIISLYSTFFILFFILFYLLDFFYKNYIFNLKIDNTYKITAPQVYKLKEKSLKKLFDDTIIGKELKNEFRSEDFYNIKNLRISNVGFYYTIKTNRSVVTFDLITKNYIDPDRLSEKLNNNYSTSINYVIDLLSKNYLLFDYNSAIEEYKLIKKKKVDLFYKNLTESDFFNKYPPAECIGDTEYCLLTYSFYYNFILNQINMNQSISTLKDTLNIDISSDNKGLEIIKDFFASRFLFDIAHLNLDKKKDYSEDEYYFFSNKYRKVINSDIFLNNISLPENKCATFRRGCFEIISNYLNLILEQHLLEQNNNFKVELDKNKKKEFNPINEIPIVFGITIFITYIFFIFTNKFFRKKLR